MTGVGRRILVIGGGASGALFSSHLLRDPGDCASVTLIEKRSTVGLGAAYSTDHPSHLLNVRAANMSAFADDPDHFLRWLTAGSADGKGTVSGASSFVARRTYGQYLISLLAPYMGNTTCAARMQIVSGIASAVTRTADGVLVRLASGATLAGDAAVLCTGFDEPTDQIGPYSSAWSRPANVGLAPSDAILILGTGLTMVDVILSLRSSGHVGPIVALSRRGLLPLPHSTSTSVKAIAEDVPIGKSVVAVTRWLRERARVVMASGGDWRSAVDAIRPFTAELWLRMPVDSKRRFLRHARAWWDIHRHRMAPSVAEEIEAATTSGQLRVLAGRVTRTEMQGNKAMVTYQPRGATTATSELFSRIINCSGMHTDPTRPDNPLVQSLISQGLARADPLGIGLDIAPDLALVSSDGTPSDRIFALGPITRATFWESTAVPDIRLQCQRLASRLARGSVSV
jgi:uncharacterized NAD(P)/FAD-binding protein YdhS